MEKKIGILDILLSSWWLRHFLFWFFILNYFTWGFGIGEGSIRDAYLRNAKFIPGHMLVVYPLLYLLIPGFLFRKKYFLFFTGFISLIFIAALFTDQFSLNFDSHDPFAGFDIRWGKNILPFIHVAAIATTIKFIKYAYFQEGRTLVASQQKTTAELELLKAQIHPHFLFNTLNNLFALTLRRSPDSPKVVDRLSELLRFMIYESSQEFIPLEKEIQLLNNYIDLEKIRYGEELELSVSFTGDIEGKIFRPLLFLPLLENSFKHGMSQQLEEKWISLELHVEKNNLYFKLANSRDPDEVKMEIQGKKKGIGLENVKRRLDLLYPGKYKFKINEEYEMFLVSIEIQVEEERQTQLSSAQINELSAFTT
jgi:Histidine kinase/GHKL domain